MQNAEIKKNMKETKETKKVLNQTEKELSNFIGDTVSKVFGVVGLSDLNSKSILKKENYYKGVKVIPLANKKYDIEVHLVLCYGLRIAEILNEVNKRLVYFIDKKYGKIYRNINIFCDDLKIL